MRRKDVAISERSAQELAYLAGVIDGEGHVQCRRAGGRELQIGVILCMADIPILDWVHERFAGSMSGTWINEKSGGRPRKIWRLSRAADLAFLAEKLSPYLILKAREMEIVGELARLSLDPKGFIANGRSDVWHERRGQLADEFRRAFEARK